MPFCNSFANLPQYICCVKQYQYFLTILFCNKAHTCTVYWWEHAINKAAFIGIKCVILKLSIFIHPTIKF